MSNSKKRSSDNGHGSKKDVVNIDTLIEENIDDLVFEDPYGDDYDSDDDDNNDENHDDSNPPDHVDDSNELNDVHKNITSNTSTNNNDHNKVITATTTSIKQVWRPGIDVLPDGEDLEYDPSAYIMYHSLQTEWPCLSFDFIKDNLGDIRHRFPLTMFVVTGSQADRAEKNKITLLKLSDMHKTYVKPDSDDDKSDDDNDEDDDGDDDLDEDPTIEHINIPHMGGVNRIRSMPQLPGIIATMSETGKAHIFDLTNTLNAFMTKGSPRAALVTKPIYSFTGHQDEGYAIDWNPIITGRLITGDCSGAIRLWNPSQSFNNNNNNNTNNGGSVSSSSNLSSFSWQVDNQSLHSHKGSVEDLQWSPSEATVFASCSSDKSIKIWDIRDKSKAQISIDAHEEDVNVISWNKSVAYLLASGCDDGSFKVWDLRTIRNGSNPLAHFTYHRGPITSIEWAINDESVISMTSADDQLTIWDLSVEADDINHLSIQQHDPSLAEYPPQLLFIHQGQQNMKELHYHPQIPGVIASTAENGMNVFKPAITVSS